MFERFKDNAFIFDRKPEGEFIVVYPTKEYPHFSFYIKALNDDTLYELTLPENKRWEIINTIKNMKLDNYWEDPTDWTQVICK